MGKGARSQAKERYYEKKQYNRIVGQLEKLHAAGYTDEDLRGRKNAWADLTQYGKVIPKDQLITPTTPGTETPVAPSVAGMTGPLGFVGDMGYAPRTPGPTLPAWVSGISGSAGGVGPGTATGPGFKPGSPLAAVSGTAGSRPAWWSTLFSPATRRVVGTGLAGLGLASQFNPFLAGTATPFFNAAANLVYPRQPGAPAGVAGRSASVTLPTAPLPNFATLPMPTTTPTTGGGYSYGYNYKRYRRGRGGGGRRYGSYAPQENYFTPPEETAPGWALGGQANWTFG